MNVCQKRHDHKTDGQHDPPFQNELKIFSKNDT